MIKLILTRNALKDTLEGCNDVKQKKGDFQEKKQNVLDKNC